MVAPLKDETVIRIPADINVTQLIQDAKDAFYDDHNVIGIGIGERRKGGAVHPDEITLIVYVKQKMPKNKIKKGYLIPAEFHGIPTDVVEPFGPSAPLEATGFVEGHHHSEDMAFVDRARLHEQWMAESGPIEWHGKVQDWGDVCMIEDDGTLVKTVSGQPTVDFVQAYKLFRTTHPDIYDFVTFFTDTANGMPPQGPASWYSFVFNDTDGIGFGPFNQRSTYGSNTLQGILFLNQGHFPIWRYVMLQEQEHRWAAFARYRDTASGPNQNDHLLGGWGHWVLEMDDDKSPMDYDIYNWEEENGDFRRIALTADERTYCDLDLYLMGLLSPLEAGDFYLLSGLTNISSNLYSATKKRLTTQNIIWAEGVRNPSVATSQKLFKNAFVVLTKDMTKAHDLVDRVDFLRLRFEQDFYEATKNLGRVDTTLGPLQVELTPGQVSQLTGGNYTSLHRHLVRSDDLRITGTQFTGTINPGQTQRWFTFNWSPTWVIQWSIRPTTSGGRLTWTEEIERAANGTFTYWLNIRNIGTVTTAFEAKFAMLR